jgi:putative flippase GtrA
VTAPLLRDRAEMVRYIINGLFATAVHFGVLTFNLDVLHVPWAGLANLMAAVVAIAVSFSGSRWFVFRGHADPILRQLWRFGLLYAAIAMLHTALLYVWTDRLGLDYRVGFLIATGMQMVLSYVGNKILVFA